MSGLVFWVATVLLTAVLATIAIVDHRSFRIPDALSLPLVASGLIAAPFLSALPSWHHLIGAVAGLAVFWGIGEWYFRRMGQEGLGLGDAKLFSAAGAWLGWQGLPLVLLIASVAGLAVALIQGQRSRKAALPFGPFIALGFLIVWLIQSPLLPPG